MSGDNSEFVAAKARYVIARFSNRGFQSLSDLPENLVADRVSERALLINLSDFRSSKKTA